MMVLSTPGDDLGPELSADGSTIYYNRDTVVAGGQNADVWYVAWPCLISAP